MKQVIPFNKEITLKTSATEITSISLDHDLQLKGEDLVTGNFYIKGKFKMNKGSFEEDFSYKIPIEIAISDDYDTYDATIDIDDFYYDLLDNSILQINIAVLIDNLVKKERCIEEEIEEEVIKQEKVIDEPIIKDENNTEKEKERINPVSVLENTNSFLNKEMNYQTYYVYLTKDDDTFDSIKEKYHTTKEDILNYNDLTEITPGIKIIIPGV